MRKKQGFTLLELTIVLAILAVLAAILIPTFLAAIDRARLRADIQSARIIQNAMELYHAETGRVLSGDIPAILGTLANAGYLDPRNSNTQTAGALWVLQNNRVMLDVSRNNADAVRRAYNNLTEDDKQFVIGGS